MEIKEQTFKEHTFRVAKGATHPEYSYFTFESEERDFRDKYWDIKKDDVVFDIGASYGTYTLSACSTGATVYCFEPEKTVFTDLVTNITLNGWSTRCFPSNTGLWSSKTLVDMKEYAPHWPQATITSLYNVETIDNIVEDNRLNKINWMKIDVEGAEVHVVQGGLKTIKRFKPNLIIECHTFLDAKLKDNVKELLSSVCEYNYEEIDREPCVMLLAKVKS
jgi:FkbM family methyltransferase